MVLSVSPAPVRQPCLLSCLHFRKRCDTSVAASAELPYGLPCSKVRCTGAVQLLALSIFIFGLACVGVFYPYNRGGLYTALIVLYALTAGIAGYIAGSYYKQMDGRAWVRNILLTSVTFCGPLFIVFCINNTVAISYRVSHTLGATVDE